MLLAAQQILAPGWETHLRRRLRTHVELNNEDEWFRTLLLAPMTARDDSVRDALVRIVRDYGRLLGEDARRCEALLKDFCPNARAEVHLLVIAARAAVPKQLLSSSAGSSRELLAARLARSLEEDYAVTAEAARWAVECWAQALGIAVSVVRPKAPVAVVTQPAAAPDAASSGQRFRDCEACPEMVVIPSGTFLMGSPDDETERGMGEGPQHRVRVTSFAIGRTAVAFAEYDRFAKASNRELPSDMGWGRGERPVINVSWADANAYAQWLSAQTGQRYRLPSEAEWECAARAGTTGPFSFDGEISPAKANYDSNYSYGGSRKDSAGFRQHTVPVGSLPANPWGLHEVHGNVWEWVEDCWHDNYGGAPSDGSAWTIGGDCGRRVLRGGSWIGDPGWLRSAYRTGYTPANRSYYVGFRLAKTL